MRCGCMVTVALIESPRDASRQHGMLTNSEGIAKMARRSDRDSGGFGLKFTAWAVSILIAVWAGHDPHQAAMVVHSIATAIASHAAHH